MTRQARRPSRAGERGFWFLALGWEGVKLAAMILVPATVVLVGSGMYGAAVYDQHHSTDPLASATPPERPAPNVNFRDFSPAGAHRDCYLKVASDRGLAWSDSTGWTAADPERPTGPDALDQKKVDQWRAKMAGLLGSIQELWHNRCDVTDLPPPKPTPTPVQEVNINGTYDVVSGNINECSVSENGNVSSIAVTRSGDTVTLKPSGSQRVLKGPLSSDLGFRVSYPDPAGGSVDIDGHFGEGTGGDVLLREGNVSVSASGSGLVAHPCSASFEAKKSAS